MAIFLESPVTHYIVVDAQDYSLFKQLESPHTQILLKEDILPWWLKKIPYVNKNLWLSFRGKLVRGWIVQQIIKIGMAYQAKEDILVFADSDVAFCRKFDFQSLVKEDDIRFYKKQACISADMEQGHYKWYKTASSLLDVPMVDFPAPDYINQLLVWRRDNAVKLCQHLEKLHQKSWIEVLSNSWDLSEYVLYGTFVDSILKDSSGHYFESSDICQNYYSEKALSDAEIEQFFKILPEDKVAVMLSAKANMPVARYSKYILDGIL